MWKLTVPARQRGEASLLKLVDEYNFERMRRLDVYGENVNPPLNIKRIRLFKLGISTRIYEMLLLSVAELFDPPFPLHGSATAAELFYVDDPVQFMHPRVSCPLTFPVLF